ncbi:putative membrane protein [Pedobacter sp. UYP30]|uniref:DUF4142 domain-containing protein n=1 Tax=Pedobacter sp. UYP30 TaxID=1756400 RepID=UPI00339425AB
MKKLIYGAAIALSVFAFQACNSNKDSKETADSLNKTKDTTTNAMNTGGIAVDKADADFATKAAAGGMAEVQIAKLALEKSTNQSVKDFATMMVTDHGKANDELMAIAKAKNITLPTAMDANHQKKYDELNGKTGKDFDKDYVNTMVDGHKSTLTLLQDEAKDGNDAELKAFAAKTAPIVQMHLDKINAIDKSMK